MITKRKRYTELTADLIWPGDQIGQREVAAVEPVTREGYVTIHFTDETSSTWPANTWVRVRRG